MLWQARLLILVASALLTRALTPRPKTPEPVKTEIPTVEEGTPVPWIFGDVWVDDAQILTYREAGRDPIREKSKK
ncbi:MAG: hypothetical protein LBV45_02075 [Xanthomonadaceae bacterium]|jgi:hypothetical protein|nr:hypothetical protein [Xanthomonadaceae bacterium]